MRTHTMNVLLLGLLASAGAAKATVFTGARAVDGFSSAQSSSGYNVGWDGFGNRSTGLLGPTYFSSPGFNCPGCTESSSGTTTPGTSATSSVDQAQASVPQGAVGAAFARANLRTGQLGVMASGQNYPIVGFTSSVEGQAFAGLGDGLNFVVAGAGPTTVTDIGVTIDLHGSMAGAGSFLQEQVLFSSPGVNDAQFLNQISVGAAPGALPVISFSNASGWVSYSFSPFTPDHLVFHGVYALTGATQHVDIGEVIYAEASNGVSDYAHTSDFSLSLPSNVTYTSDSGVFLTGANGVPEPGAWSLALLGLGLAGAALRRRARNLAPA
jgi:hypothetical protein